MGGHAACHRLVVTGALGHRPAVSPLFLGQGTLTGGQGEHLCEERTTGLCLFLV